MANTIRLATRGVVEEFKDMEVNDMVAFPIPKYNYNTIRSTPSTGLVPLRLEGWKWRQRLDIDNKRVIVTRIS